jgi:hypothetical protein
VIVSNSLKKDTHSGARNKNIGTATISCFLNGEIIWQQMKIISWCDWMSNKH